jgi:3-oxoacyl-ACP reductase-like protein
MIAGGRGKRRKLMGIFSTIKNAIWGHKAAATAPAPQPQAAPAATAAPQPQPAPQPVAVDIEAVLTQMQAEKGTHLNWQSSIVDLMKLVGMDSSLTERKELAQELGYTGALDGSAEMNIWLHKRVLKELAANGGKVPAGLLD